MKRSVITLKKPSRKTVVDAAIPFLLLLLSFLFSSIWILLMGKNPLAAYMALLDGAFGSPAALMNTIKKSVPISFASFAIIVSMKGNSFNIGAEGQLALGAIGATLAGALIPGLPAPLHIAVCLSAGAVFGMLYILFPAVMHVRRGVDLLVILLLLNNVASYILQYFVLDFFKSDNALVPSSRKILETAELPYLILMCQVKHKIFGALHRCFLLDFCATFMRVPRLPLAHSKYGNPSHTPQRHRRYHRGR